MRETNITIRDGRLVVKYQIEAGKEIYRKVWHSPIV